MCNNIVGKAKVNAEYIDLAPLFTTESYASSESEIFVSDVDVVISLIIVVVLVFKEFEFDSKDPSSYRKIICQKFHDINQILLYSPHIPNW